MLKFIEFNANPKGRKTGDCSTRALATCLGISWEQALSLQYEMALKTKYDTTDRKVIEKILNEYGYEKQKQPKKVDNTKYLVKELDKYLSEKERKYPIIVNVANHYVVIKGDNYYDTWNSGNKTVGNYYLKVRKENKELSNVDITKIVPQKKKRIRIEL